MRIVSYNLVWAAFAHFHTVSTNSELDSFWAGLPHFAGRPQCPKLSTKERQLTLDLDRSYMGHTIVETSNSIVLAINDASER